MGTLRQKQDGPWDERELGSGILILIDCSLPPATVGGVRFRFSVLEELRHICDRLLMYISAERSRTLFGGYTKADCAVREQLLVKMRR